MTKVTSSPVRSDGELETALQSLDPISLSEMEDVALLDRVNTKYVFPREKLLRVLDGLSADYRCLCVSGSHVQTYNTLYFDTADSRMYRMHHDGHGSRMKVRKRWYVGSGLAFLEVKRRDNKKRTVKQRARLPGDSAQERESFEEWARKSVEPFPINELIPQTWTFFDRITLVSKQGVERLTIDCNIRWSRANDEELPSESERKGTAEDFCVAELKRSGLQTRTTGMLVLRDNRIRPGSFSKYCVGTALLHPHLKQGGFKPTLHRLGGLDS